MRYYIRRFFGTLMFFAAIVALGTVAYQVVEGWSLGDSFYMTVITVTAVGYAEVHPLSQAGRLLTLLVLFGGITGMGLWFAFNPVADTRLEPGDQMIVLGRAEQIRELKGYAEG